MTLAGRRHQQAWRFALPPHAHRTFTLPQSAPLGWLCAEPGKHCDSVHRAAYNVNTAMGRPGSWEDEWSGGCCTAQLCCPIAFCARGNHRLPRICHAPLSFSLQHPGSGTVFAGGAWRRRCTGRGVHWLDCCWRAAHPGCAGMFRDLMHGGFGWCHVMLISWFSLHTTSIIPLQCWLLLMTLLHCWSGLRLPAWRTCKTLCLLPAW